jgi:hypothetical protein
MAEFFEPDGLLTTNELTPIYGKSIYKISGNSDENFRRGVVIYIGGTQLQYGNSKIFHPRFVYHDYDEAIPDQNSLELAVLSLGRQGKLQAAAGKAFPDVFSADMSKVNFGWTPCIVTYILDVYGYQFQQSDPAGNLERSLNQPIVFRKTKAVVTDNGSASAYKYLGNQQGTFSDLEHLSVDGVSSLRFYNNMLDESGEVPPKPDDYEVIPAREYCMDIYIRTEQGRKVFSLSEEDIQAIKVGDTAYCCDLIEKNEIAPMQYLAMVFDPPQTNGGSSGPP